jgi:predicted Zn-dependent peptidase
MKNSTSFPGEEQVRRTVLNNGIRVVSERMPYVRSVSLGVWVRAGSGDENMDNNGIAHFLEHMLFKGTARRSAKEIAQSLESRGGGLNGATGKEVSSFTAQVLDEDLPLAIDVLADLLQFSKFDPTDIELEKQVVLSEMALANDDPEELAFDHFYKNLYPHHPLGYFIYGSEDNVQKFKRQDLVSFLETNYTHDRLVVSAAGNVDHDEFVRLVNAAFDGVVSAGSAGRMNGQFKPPSPLKKQKIKGLHQTHICMGMRTFSFLDERKYALALLDALLGGGMSSRLFQNIREKYGFTYSVFSFADLMAETGVFGAYLACEKAKLDESLELLNAEFINLQNGELDEDELELVKSQVRGNLILGLESSGRRMKKIGESEIYGEDHHSAQEIVASINAVTPSNVIDLVNTFFRPENTNITILSS